MDEQEVQNGQPLETEQDFSEAPDMEALMNEGQQEPTQEPEPQQEPTPEANTVDEEKEALKAQVKRENDRLNGIKADKNLIAQTMKKVMDEYGIDFEEAAKMAGISANDLKARIESVDASGNPVMQAAQEFDDLYINKGGKTMLDEIYGADTQKYVNAFANIGLQDPQLKDEYLSLEPAKRLVFVAKTGKELLEEVGENVSVRQLAKELAKAKAEIQALKQTKPAEQSDKRTKLPLAGAAGTSSAVKPADGVERLFYSN